MIVYELWPIVLSCLSCLSCLSSCFPLRAAVPCVQSPPLHGVRPLPAPPPIPLHTSGSTAKAKALAVDFLQEFFSAAPGYDAGAVAREAAGPDPAHSGLPVEGEGEGEGEVEAGVEFIRGPLDEGSRLHTVLRLLAAAVRVLGP
jgi:hypothetical protein